MSSRQEKEQQKEEGFHVAFRDARGLHELVKSSVSTVARSAINNLGRESRYDGSQSALIGELHRGTLHPELLVSAKTIVILHCKMNPRFQPWSGLITILDFSRPKHEDHPSGLYPETRVHALAETLRSTKLDASVFVPPRAIQSYWNIIAVKKGEFLMKLDLGRKPDFVTLKERETLENASYRELSLSCEHPFSHADGFMVETRTYADLLRTMIPTVCHERGIALPAQSMIFRTPQRLQPL